MKKINIYLIILIALVLGAFGAVFSIEISFLLIGIVVLFVMLLCNYERALYILGAYSFVDYILRNYVTAFASIWDDLLLVFMVCLWGYKWLTNRKSENFKQAPLDFSIIFFIVTMLFVLIVNTQDYSIGLEGFRAIVQYVLWYFVALQLLKDTISAKNVCLVFVLITGIMALHGVYQYIIGVEIPVGWVDQAEAGVRTRVYSILTSPNIFGSLMTLATPICLSFVFSEKKVGKKLIFGGLALAMMGSLVFTFSRGAWIGFMAAIGIYVLLRDKRMIIPVIIGALLLVIFVPSVMNRIAYMLSPEYIESSLRGGRLVRWINGLKILETSPLLGIGLGHFGGAVAINNDLYTIVDSKILKTYYMDNYYLKTAVESGIVGLFSFVILMYQVFICSFRSIKISISKSMKELQIGILAGLTGVIIHNFVENVFEVPMMTSCFWLLVAVSMHIWYINFYKDKDFSVKKG